MLLKIFNVLFRVFLIAIGLVSIASGGLCVLLGSESSDSLFIALIGLLGLAFGALMVWAVIRAWRREGVTADQSGMEPRE